MPRLFAPFKWLQSTGHRNGPLGRIHISTRGECTTLSCIFGHISFRAVQTLITSVFSLASDLQANACRLRGPEFQAILPPDSSKNDNHHQRSKRSPGRGRQEGLRCSGLPVIVVVVVVARLRCGQAGRAACRNWTRHRCRLAPQGGSQGWPVGRFRAHCWSLGWSRRRATGHQIPGDRRHDEAGNTERTARSGLESGRRERRLNVTGERIRRREARFGERYGDCKGDAPGIG